MHLQNLQQHHCFFPCLGYEIFFLLNPFAQLWNLTLNPEWRTLKAKLIHSVTINHKLESKLAALKLRKMVFTNSPPKDPFLPCSGRQGKSFASLGLQHHQDIGRWLYLMRCNPEYCVRSFKLCPIGQLTFPPPPHSCPLSWGRALFL